MLMDFFRSNHIRHIFLAALKRLLALWARWQWLPLANIEPPGSHILLALLTTTKPMAKSY